MRAWLQEVIDYTHASIFVMDGNHDKWLWKILASTLPEWALEFFTDPIDLIIHDLPPERISRAKTEFNAHYPSGDVERFTETRFLFPLGDALFSHMNFTGKNAGDGVRRLGAWIDQWHHVLGMPDFTCLVQFHGHKIAAIEDKGGFRALIEPGMGGSLSVEGYKTVYDGKWMPGNLGFVTFTQHHQGGDVWRTDTDSIDIVRPRRLVKPQTSFEV